MTGPVRVSVVIEIRGGAEAEVDPSDHLTATTHGRLTPITTRKEGRREGEKQMGQKGHHETSGPYLQTATAPLSLSLCSFFPYGFSA